jgi:hypothetical protein
LDLEEEAEEADTGGEAWAEAGDEGASWPGTVSALVAARSCPIARESPAFR